MSRQIALDRIHQIELRVKRRQYYIDAIARLRNKNPDRDELDQFENYLRCNSDTNLGKRVIDLYRLISLTQDDIQMHQNLIDSS
jgi:hypothetical protein